MVWLRKCSFNRGHSLKGEVVPKLHRCPFKWGRSKQTWWLWEEETPCSSKLDNSHPQEFCSQKADGRVARLLERMFRFSWLLYACSINLDIAAWVAFRPELYGWETPWVSCLLTNMHALPLCVSWFVSSCHDLSHCVMIQTHTMRHYVHLQCETSLVSFSFIFGQATIFLAFRLWPAYNLNIHSMLSCQCDTNPNHKHGRAQEKAVQHNFSTY